MHYVVLKEMLHGEAVSGGFLTAITAVFTRSLVLAIFTNHIFKLLIFATFFF
jgi:hypothetical protein